jgi:iron complex outermembrane receptor protein
MNTTIPLKAGFLITIFTLFLNQILTCQEIHEVKILDLDNSQPVIGLNFNYGNQSGISDINGTIRFKLLEGDEMKLSHINYGRIILTGEEVCNMINLKEYLLKKITLNLYPVTVIAVKPQPPTQGFGIEHYDKMLHDGAAILNQSPLIGTIRKGGNYGLDPVFRGFKYDQLNIVMDGAQSATAACPNRMDPPTSQMAPNMTDRIEIMKGPHALRFGSGLGATINFIPSKIEYAEKLKVNGRFSGGYETNGNLARSEGKLGFSGKKLHLDLFAAWSESDDYKDGEGETVQADFKRGSFGSRLGVKLGKNQSLNLSANYNIARDADFPALAMDLREDNTWMLNANHSLSINKEKLRSWNTSIYASFVDHRMDNLLKQIEARTLTAETIANTSNFGGRTETSWNLLSGQLFLGADLRSEGAEGTRTRELYGGHDTGKILYDNVWQNGYITKTGLFGEYRWNNPIYQFIFSGRLELNSSGLNDPDNRFDNEYPDAEQVQLNSGLSIGLKRSLRKGMNIGLWLGRVQRSAGLIERFINFFPVGQDPYEMLGNPELNPETNYQADLELGWKTEKTSIQVDLFASLLENMISSVIDTTQNPRLMSSPGVRRFTNIDRAIKSGFEISWTQILPANLYHQLGIAYTFAKDLERNEPLPEIPPLDLLYIIQGNYFTDKLQPQVSFRHAMKQERISNGYGETTTPAFSIVNVKIVYDIATYIKVTAGVNNLLNENYYEHLHRSVRGMNKPIYSPGRSFYMSLGVQF